MQGCSFVIFSAQLDYNIEMHMKRFSNALLSTWQLNTSVLSVLVTCKKKSWPMFLTFFVFSYFHSLQQALRYTCSGSWYQSSCLSWHIISGTMNFTSYRTAILHVKQNTFEPPLLSTINFYSIYETFTGYTVIGTTLGTSSHSCQVTGSQASVPAHTQNSKSLCYISLFSGC